MRNTARGLGLALLMALTGCLPGSLYSNKHMAKESYTAPPITAIDADGQVMRLKDHKGKVVLLSFWKTNCPPCRAMFEHEKTLVANYASRPFVLLGVNADASPFELKRTQQRAGLTWRSWWDGPGGEICTVWGVDCLPAFFLLDADGVVQWRHLGVPPEGVMEQKVEELVTATEKKQTKG
jgi:thiol-disulfide isomerase/thioredoxin